MQNDFPFGVVLRRFSRKPLMEVWGWMCPDCRQVQKDYVNPFPSGKYRLFLCKPPNPKGCYSFKKKKKSARSLWKF
jgi:hypothetical protein